MEIGTLNQRITLLEQRVKVDAIGNHCNRWDSSAPSATNSATCPERFGVGCLMYWTELVPSYLKWDTGQWMRLQICGTT